MKIGSNSEENATTIKNVETEPKNYRQYKDILDYNTIENNATQQCNQHNEK